MQGSRKKLAKAISDKTGLPVATTAKFVNAAIENITAWLQEKKKLTIRNFGTFTYKLSPKRPGMNLSTMEKMEIDERYVIKFRPSKNLHRYINDQ